MTDSGDSRKLTKVTGDFTITFSGDNASELNGQASNWTRGIIDGDGLMTVKDLGSGFFETYIYLLPDDTEQHIYWELRFQSQSSYSVDLSGFPVIEDTDLGGGLSTFFDFRGPMTATSGRMLAA